MPISDIKKSDVSATAERFWKRVRRGDSSLCWPWVLTLDRDGYGKYSLRGYRVMAHRVAWAIHNGSGLPSGKVVMHSCDNPRCCNPAHLALGSQIQNLADRDAKGRTALGRSPMRPQQSPNEVAPAATQTPIRLERDAVVPSRTPRSTRSTAEIMDSLLQKKARRKEST